jgi:hypothetical protein
MEDAAPKTLAELLDDWRVAERRLAMLGPGDGRRRAIEEQVELSRRAYHEAEAVHRSHAAGASGAAARLPGT